MELPKIINFIYPSLVNGTDYSIQDDGNGQFISSWNSELQIPTDEELEVVWDQIKDLPVTPLKTLEELTMENEQLKLEVATAKEDNISNMMAITEIYELMLGGGL
ncbi:XkdW family protein [Fictibacillus sp. JL2B1089]|uniref:XkdW family protein n=1 Tax=Fictibacillus sp. JL2B1089 TaxID=3399565 RepID=UPI003A88561C